MILPNISDVISANIPANNTSAKPSAPMVAIEDMTVATSGCISIRKGDIILFAELNRYEKTPPYFLSGAFLLLIFIEIGYNKVFASLPRGGTVPLT